MSYWPDMATYLAESIPGLLINLKIPALFTLFLTLKPVFLLNHIEYRVVQNNECDSNPQPPVSF